MAPTPCHHLPSGSVPPAACGQMGLGSDRLTPPRQGPPRAPWRGPLTRVTRDSKMATQAHWAVLPQVTWSSLGNGLEVSLGASGLGPKMVQVTQPCPCLLHCPGQR